MHNDNAASADTLRVLFLSNSQLNACSLELCTQALVACGCVYSHGTMADCADADEPYGSWFTAVRS